MMAQRRACIVCRLRLMPVEVLLCLAVRDG